MSPNLSFESLLLAFYPTSSPLNSGQAHDNKFLLHQGMSTIGRAGGGSNSCLGNITFLSSSFLTRRGQLE